jgi:hypothetical protein
MITVTVTEALRIQKEIAQIVQETMRKEGYLDLGICTEDGVVVNSSNGYNVPLPDYIAALQRVFRLSQTISSILGRFAVTSGVADKVRERENFKALQRAYESAIGAMPQNEVSRFEVIGNERKKISQLFSPFISKKNLKEEIKNIKANIRSLQSEIDAANSKMIELPFDYEDLEAFKEGQLPRS